MYRFSTGINCVWSGVFDIVYLHMTIPDNTIFHQAD